jgi:tetratricopeptide (TPR) repeat protein
MSREQDVPRGTVLVLPTRERLEARLTEARLFSPAPEDEGAAPPDGAARPAVSLKRRREAAAAYERGLAALAEHRPDDALREWEAAWAGDPGYPGLAERLTTEYRVRGLEAFSRGELGVAVGLWERALEVDPTDGTTLGYLQRAREQQVRSEQILKSGDAR